jgi:hypothetical protein
MTPATRPLAQDFSRHADLDADFTGSPRWILHLAQM